MRELHLLASRSVAGVIFTIYYEYDFGPHYQYDFGSHVVSGKMSVVKSEANEYRDGKKPFVLIADPTRPEKFLMKNDVFPRAGKWNWWSGYQNEPKTAAD